MKIENKEMKTAKTGAKYCCFTIDGRKYNVFDKELIMGFNLGDDVVIETEQNGAFVSLVGMEKITTEKVVPNGSKGEFHLSPEAVRSNALNSAIDWMKGVGNNAFKELMPIVAVFEEYILNGQKLQEGSKA